MQTEVAFLVPWALQGFLVETLHTLPAYVGRTWEALRAELGDLGVDRDLFIDRVIATARARISQARISDDGDLQAAVDCMHLPDLYLAMGCLAGNKMAAEHFLALYAQPLRALAREAAHGDLAEEIEQQVLASLFTDPDSARLATYQGRGPLHAWLRVVLHRVASDVRRRPAVRCRVDLTAEHRETFTATEGTPQDALAERELAAGVVHLIRAVLEELPHLDRELLAAYYRDGEVLKSLGATHGLALTTVHRRLAKARDRLCRTLCRRADDVLGVSAEELRHLIGRIAAHLDIDTLFDTDTLFEVGVVFLAMLLLRAAAPLAWRTWA